MSQDQNLRKAARAVVIHDENLLVMLRNNNGRKYMVTPGGRLEPGEKPEEALLRELAEETMITVANPLHIFTEEPNDSKWGTQYIYLCEYVSGNPQLDPNSEEEQDNAIGNNLYNPIWFKISDLPSEEYPFRSERLLDEILHSLKHGFPAEPKKWILDSPVVE